MKKISQVLFVLIVFLVVGNTLSAQSPLLGWAYNLGASSDDVAYGQAKDVSGNLYTVGAFKGTIDLNPGPGFLMLSSAGDYDIFIQKLDPSGNLLWGKRIGGIWGDQAYDVAIDNSGNVLVTGGFRNTVDFDPGSGVTNLVADNSIQSYCVFVLKLDSNGNFQWAKKAETTTIGYGIDTDNSGNVYSAGYMGSGWLDFNPGSGTSTIAGDIFIWKLDSDGNYVWAKALYDAGSSTALSVGMHGLQADGTGNVFVTGSFDETQDFDPGGGITNLVSLGSQDAYLLKLNSTGTFQWVKQFGGSSLDYGKALHRTSSGDLYITGLFMGIADFDPDSGTGNYAFQSAGSLDVFALKTDANGNVAWATAFGGPAMEYVGDISVNSLNEVCVTGTFQETADFNPDLVETDERASVGGKDIFIEKLDANGQFQWARTYGSSSDDNGWAVLFGPGNCIYAAGDFYSTIDFDPAETTFELTSAGSGDIYVLKYYECSDSESEINPVACETYISPSGNYIWYASGTYYDTIPNTGGCDSIITINLTVNNPVTGTDVITACDSYEWIDGVTYTSNNSTATHTFVNGASNGCDSIVTLNLTVNHPVTGTDVITACDSYEWIDGVTYTSDNTTATYTIVNGALNGCDSIVTLNLTVNTVDNSVTTDHNTIYANETGAEYKWLDCDNDFAVLPGETSQSFTATANGNYAVVVSLGECSDTSACVSITGVNIPGQDSGDFVRIYPNPGQGIFTIELSNIENNTVNLYVYNVLGELVEYVSTGKLKNEIDLSGQPAGIYYVSLDTRNGRITKKIIIQ